APRCSTTTRRRESGRGGSMPTYIMLSTLTAQGVQTLKANPERLREVNRDVEELGAKVVHQWATLGPFDFVNVVEAPDPETIERWPASSARSAVSSTSAWLEPVEGRRRLAGEAGVGDHELTVDLERAAVAAFVQEREHEGGHRLARDVLGGGFFERLLEEWL